MDSDLKPKRQVGSTFTVRKKVVFMNIKSRGNMSGEILKGERHFIQLGSELFPAVRISLEKCQG